MKCQKCGDDSDIPPVCPLPHHHPTPPLFRFVLTNFSKTRTPQFFPFFVPFQDSVHIFSLVSYTMTATINFWFSVPFSLFSLTLRSLASGTNTIPPVRNHRLVNILHSNNTTTTQSVVFFGGPGGEGDGYGVSFLDYLMFFLFFFGS